LATADTLGCNLLGALLLLGGVCTVGELAGDDAPGRRDWNDAVRAGAAICAAAVDLGWRLALSQAERWRRWLFPLEGGCVLWAPVWVLAVVLVLVPIGVSRLR
jgi:hypothetical protein